MVKGRQSIIAIFFAQKENKMDLQTHQIKSKIKQHRDIYDHASGVKPVKVVVITHHHIREQKSRILYMTTI